MQRDSSVTLHVSKKKTISEEKLKITFTKIQNFTPDFFPEWFGHKKLNIHVFKVSHKKSAQTVKWVLILKGLKHLNTVL